MENEITPSSGNVFKDLGFEAGEAETLRVRARLMTPLECYVREWDLTQMDVIKERGTGKMQDSDGNFDAVAMKRRAARRIHKRLASEGKSDRLAY